MPSAVAASLFTILLVVPFSTLGNSVITSPVIGANRSFPWSVCLVLAGMSSVFLLLRTGSDLGRAQKWLASFLGVVQMGFGFAAINELQRGNQRSFDALSCVTSLGIAFAVVRFLNMADRWWALPVLILSVTTIVFAVTGTSVLAVGGVHRAAGGSGAVTETSECLAVLTPLSVVPWLKRPRPYCYGAALVWALALLALLLTGSWGAGTAGIASSAALAIVKWPNRILLWCACAACMILILVSIRTSTPAGQRSNAASKMGRLQLFAESFRRLGSTWPRGEGFEPAELTIVNPVTHRLASSEDPHFEPLFVSEQFGVLGLIAFIFFCLLVTWNIKDAGFATPNGVEYSCLAALALCLVESPLCTSANYSNMLTFGVLGASLVAGRPAHVPVNCEKA